MDDPLLRPTDRGLLCERGGFFVDPLRPVETAVVTHAHADHATPGCHRYIASPNTAALLRVRIGRDIDVTELAYGQTTDLGAVRVSLHPAGHVLGSAQVRLEPATDAKRVGGVWVVTGDYKTDPDPSCEPFETVACDTLLTESTFGLPIYRWPDAQGVMDDLNAWWRSNAALGRTSVVACYALGKAQRVLAGLDGSIGPIGLHGAMKGTTRVYRDAGIALPETVHANAQTAPEIKGRGLVLAPPSAIGGPWLRRFDGSGGTRTAMASGWMRVRGRRRWRAVDRGFVLSDHADWDGLLRTIQQSGATRVGVTHGSSEALARYLREERGLESFVVPTRYTGEGDDSESTPDQGESDENGDAGQDSVEERD